MFVSIYGVFQKRFVDLSTCQLVAFVACHFYSASGISLQRVV